MPKKRATSTASKTSVKKKTATKKKSVAPRASTKASSASKRSTKKTAKKKTAPKVTEKKLTRADLPPELIAQITSELRAELRSEIDFKVQTAIAREREYLASITTPCRYRPYDELEADLEERPLPQIKFLNEIPDDFLRVEDERTQRWKDLKPQYDRGIELMDKYGKEIMNMPGVTGLHVGFKRKNNTIIHPLQYSLRISVNRKRQKNDARIFKILPDYIDGYPTDILEREFESLGDCIPTDSIVNTAEAIGSGNSTFHNTLVRPLRGGIPIAAEGTPNNWGTLGILGFGNDRKYYGLTCSHVVNQQGKQGDTVNSIVIQPPSSSSTASRTIGEVIDSVRDDQVDVSIIEINESVEAEFGQIYDERTNSQRLSIQLNEGNAQLGRSAFLAGAASNPIRKARGRIQCIKGHIRTTDNHVFYDQIFVDKFKLSDADIIKPGDSGSILLMTGLQYSSSLRHSAIGIVHAKDLEKGAIVACPWSIIGKRIPLFNKIRWF
jgi:hypothetical protein